MVGGGIYAQVDVRSWDLFRNLVMSRENWIFRGHGRVHWKLETSLERCLRLLDSVPGQEETQGIQRPSLLATQSSAEYETLRDFQRRAHHWVASPPKQIEILEWAALLRHHGGPTRLLDVTRSPYVAAYFAVEESLPGEPFAVFAFWRGDLHVRGVTKLRDRGFEIDQQSYSDLAHACFDERPSRLEMVVPGEPERTNERMAAQQGLFLVPSDLTCSFERNLLATFGIEDDEFHWDDAPMEAVAQAPLVKMVFDAKMRSVVMRELRAMNISAATLYPGLDGFARSLAVGLKFRR